MYTFQSHETRICSPKRNEGSPNLSQSNISCILQSCGPTSYSSFSLWIGDPRIAGPGQGCSPRWDKSQSTTFSTEALLTSLAWWGACPTYGVWMNKANQLGGYGQKERRNHTLHHCAYLPCCTAKFPSRTRKSHAITEPVQQQCSTTYAKLGTLTKPRQLTLTDSNM